MRSLLFSLLTACLAVGCATAPRVPSFETALLEYRDGSWSRALPQMEALWEQGRHRGEVAPFLAAARYVQESGPGALEEALALLEAASEGSGTARPPGAPFTPAERMYAHLLATALQQALLCQDLAQVERLTARPLASARLPRLCEYYLTRARVQAGRRVDRSRLDRLERELPGDAGVAQALRLYHLREGQPDQALRAWRRVALPAPAGDLLDGRRREPERALASGDRLQLARALARRGWLAEAHVVYEELCEQGKVEPQEVGAFERDRRGLQALVEALVLYHQSARANPSGTTRAGGGLGLPALEEQLRCAMSDAGLSLRACSPHLQRPLPFVVELDPLAVLEADLHPPARPGEDSLVEMLARYGMVLDLIEILGVVEARLYRVHSLEPVSFRYRDQVVSTRVLMVDETVVPGGVRYRLGVGGISGRAFLSQGGLLVVGDVLRPSWARLRRLQERVTTLAAPVALALPEHDVHRQQVLLQGWFDPSWDQPTAFHRVLALEIAHTRAHELGHAVDLGTLLPLAGHLDKALHVALAGGLSPARIESRFEEAAEAYALATGPDACFAAHGILGRLEIDPYAPGAILAAALGSRPWQTSYVEAARRLAREVDRREAARDGEALRAIGEERALQLGLSWPRR